MVQSFDDEQYFEEKEAVVRLQIADKNKPVKNKLQQIKRVLSDNKNDYSNARIRIKPRNSKEYSIPWNSSTGFADEYIKRVVVKPFSPDLKATYSEIYTPLMSRMISEANKHA